MPLHAAPRRRAVGRRSILLAVVAALGLAALAPVITGANASQSGDKVTNQLYACRGRQLDVTRAGDSRATLTCLTHLAQMGPAATSSARRSDTARTTVPHGTNRHTLLVATASA